MDKRTPTTASENPNKVFLRPKIRVTKKRKKKRDSPIELPGFEEARILWDCFFLAWRAEIDINR